MIVDKRGRPIDVGEAQRTTGALDLMRQKLRLHNGARAMSLRRRQHLTEAVDLLKKATMMRAHQPADLLPQGIHTSGVYTLRRG